MLSEIETFKKKISDHEDAVLQQMELPRLAESSCWTSIAKSAGGDQSP